MTIFIVIEKTATEEKAANVFNSFNEAENYVCNKVYDALLMNYKHTVEDFMIREEHSQKGILTFEQLEKLFKHLNISDYSVNNNSVFIDYGDGKWHKFSILPFSI